MNCRKGNARALIAFGRFLFLVLSPAFVFGCATAQGGSQSEVERPPADPVVQPGPISPARTAQAAELFGRAEEAFEAGRYSAAREMAGRVVTEYAAAPVSGRALFLQARAALMDSRFQEADAAAGRYAALLPVGDARIAPARLLQAEAQDELGDQAERLARLLAIGEGSPVNARIRATDQGREAAAALDLFALTTLLERVEAVGPVAPIALARQSRLLLEAGYEEDAQRYAGMALQAGAQGADSAIAEAVLAGDLSGGRTEARVVPIATFLPVTGSPAMQDFAALVAEGIEVAAVSVLGDEAVVQVEAMDDAGDPTVVAALMGELSGGSAVGAVGFLEDRILEAAAQGRVDELPLFSPTARAAPADREAVFTMAGADPLAAGAVARHGAASGILRASVIHSKAPESVAEANVIVAALEAAGVGVVGRFAYEVGATFFGEQIAGAQEALRGEEIRALNLGEEDTLHVELLDPVALFLPIPPEDVEFLAPQVTHFGLDTLGIAMLGTSGWTDPEVLATVDTRHTDRVVATAAVEAGPGSRGHARFKEAYEEHFQRSLTSPIPALGYDATLLLLEGFRIGGMSRGALRSAIGRISELEGATGIFSVVGGQVVRRTQLVRLDHGVMIPIG